MGSCLSDEQAALLAHTVARKAPVRILFDADDAGRNGAQQALLKLAPHCFVQAITLNREGLQPDQLSPAEILELLK